MSRIRPGLAALVVLTATTLRGAWPATAEEPDLRAKIEKYVEKRASVYGFSGTILVARGGEPIFRQGYGLANREHDVPNTPLTKFRLGSITKQFTAAAVLLLQEQGKLDVRDAIKTHLPDCPEAWDAITIHHLLTHTSGIPSYTSFPGYLRTMRYPTTPDELIARFRDRPLEFKPGERFAYSNSGYTVLGRIIEEVSGKSYREFLRARIFEPLEMGDTGYDDPAPLLKHRASGYTRGLLRTLNAPYLDMSVPYASGALYSTVDDLLKWDRALATDQLLSKKSRDAMFTPSLDRYGYGWIIASAFGRAMVAHGGGINGFATDIRRFPEDRVCVIVLSNIEQAQAGKIGNDLSAIVFGAGEKAGAAAAEGPGRPAKQP